ncbi:MAG: ANTAR domain-containing response regulator [Hyphomicrobium sp.]
MSNRAETQLRILVLDESPVRRALLLEGLVDAGFEDVVTLEDPTGLVQNIYRLDPDVILIDLESPSRDVLDQMFQVSRVVRRPIAMFVDQSDRSAIDAAIEAGVSAYIVDGLKKERLKPLLDMTISRFNAFDRLQRELDDARGALKERKSVEKAKGILMKSRGLDEEAAYALLRKTAMSQSKKIADVAEGLISAFDLLGKGD